MMTVLPHPSLLAAMANCKIWHPSPAGAATLALSDMSEPAPGSHGRITSAGPHAQLPHADDAVAGAPEVGSVG